MQPTTLSWTSKMTVHVMGLVLGGTLLSGIAAALSKAIPLNGPTAIIVSGGNLDFSLLCS